MSEYTPEKVAELVADATSAWETAGLIPQGTMVHETQWLPFANLYNVAESLIDALTAVSADRDRLHKAITEALAERMSMGADRILRAALDKEPHASNVSEHPETGISAGQMSVNAPAVGSQFYEGLAAARRAPCIRAVPGSVIPCCGVSTDGETTNHEIRRQT